MPNGASVLEQMVAKTSGLGQLLRRRWREHRQKAGPRVPQPTVQPYSTRGNPGVGRAAPAAPAVGTTSAGQAGTHGRPTQGPSSARAAAGCRLLPAAHRGQGAFVSTCVGRAVSVGLHVSCHVCGSLSVPGIGGALSVGDCKSRTCCAMCCPRNRTASLHAADRLRAFLPACHLPTVPVYCCYRLSLTVDILLSYSRGLPGVPCHTGGLMCQTVGGSEDLAADG